MNIPYVIEGEGQKERVYDLYSRLLKDRIIFIGSEFTDALANSVVAQLLFLEADDPEKDIVMYINSPGGMVTALISIYDTMNYIKPSVSTVCLGHAASAGAFILASGTKGKRYALKNSRIMVHQISAGAGGNISDMEITFNETKYLNERLLQELSNITGHSMSKLKKDMDRDNYMSADEAKEYGLIDEVLIDRG